MWSAINDWLRARFSAGIKYSVLLNNRDARRSTLFPSGSDTSWGAKKPEVLTHAYPWECTAVCVCICVGVVNVSVINNADPRSSANQSPAMRLCSTLYWDEDMWDSVCLRYSLSFMLFQICSFFLSINLCRYFLHNNTL